MPIRRALVSVSDKRALITFLQSLSARGVEVRAGVRVPDGSTT